MKTRIVMEKLTGESLYTYFLDYFDPEQGGWKNYHANKNLTSIEFAQADLITNGLSKDEPPKLYSGYTEEQIQRIIKGGYLIYYGDSKVHYKLLGLKKDEVCRYRLNDDTWGSSNIKLVRDVGIKQPWFGGEYDGNKFDPVLFEIAGWPWSCPTVAQNISWEYVTDYILLE